MLPPLLVAPIPTERTPLLKRAGDLYAALSQTVDSFHSSSEEDAAELALALCRWRYSLCKLRWRDDEDTAAVYLAEAAMRLALLDWLHAQPEPDAAAARVFSR
jgi:hypothetical protein